LLELLVVIVIVGIIVAIATISFAPRDQTLEKNADRLRALTLLAADEALMQGQEMGLTFFPGGYEFAVLDPTEGIWVRMTADEMFYPRQLDERLEMDLFIEDQQILLETGEPPAAEDYEPQIFLLSSGEITPFSVRFRPAFDNYGVLLEIKADGKASVSADET